MELLYDIICSQIENAWLYKLEDRYPEIADDIKFNNKSVFEACPKLDRCFVVSAKLRDNLDSLEDFNKYFEVEFHGLEIPELGMHAFLVITSKKSGKQYLVDANYQQFVLSENMKDLPPVMILELTTKEQLIKDLTEHNIWQRQFDLWAESCFPDSNSANCLRFDYSCENNDFILLSC